jgi:hypothetical protein
MCSFHGWNVKGIWDRVAGLARDLYVTPDPQSIREAEEREARECRAASSVVAVHVISRAARERAAFWRYVEAKAQRRATVRPFRGGVR